MSATPHITGYAMSVYSRAVRMALAAKDVAYDYSEADPFDVAQRPGIPHPFGRVPVMCHDGFELYETQAILDYIDATWGAQTLTPTTAQGKARMRQVMGITDAYVYGDLVRKAVSQALFVPMEGGQPDPAVLAEGLAPAEAVLAELDRIAGEGLVLDGTTLSLADCLLWPMLDYLRLVPDGAELMQNHAHLWRWVGAMEALDVARSTKPDLAAYAAALT